MGLNELLTSQKPPENGKWDLKNQDLTKFFWKYKGLLKEAERNNAFWMSTNDNMKSAYEKLDYQERELLKAYNLNRKFLDNIKEGLLLIDSNFMILEQYSDFLEELFKTKRVAGLSILDFIYPDKQGSQEDRKVLSKYLNLLFKNTSADQEMLSEMNPLVEKELSLVNLDYQVETIIVNVDFIRIMAGSSVDNIMVIFQDITHIVKMQKELQYEKDKHEEELESISAIIKAGPQSFQGFINDLIDVIGQLQSFLDNDPKKNSLDVLFRNIHSLKGTSRYMNLNYIANQSHKIEDLLVKYKKKTTVITEYELKEEIKKGIQNLNAAVQNITKMQEIFINFSRSSAELKDLNQESLANHFLISLQDMVADISNTMNKEIKLQIDNTIHDFPYLEEVKSPIIHLLRNAVDHGIEDKFERLSHNKKAQGHIKLGLHQKENNYIIEIYDDGRGIDFEKVKQKAIDKKLIVKKPEDVSKLELLNIMLLPDFSTKEVVSDISGRGYGLDIVKDTLTKLRGKIAVATEMNKGTRFTLMIPVKQTEEKYV